MSPFPTMILSSHKEEVGLGSGNFALPWPHTSSGITVQVSKGSSNSFLQNRVVNSWSLIMNFSHLQDPKHSTLSPPPGEIPALFQGSIQVLLHPHIFPDPPKQLKHFLLSEPHDSHTKDNTINNRIWGKSNQNERSSTTDCAEFGSVRPVPPSMTLFRNRVSRYN